MRNRLKQLLWFCLALSLIFSYSGLGVRLSNEYNNNTVVTVLDHEDFFAAVSRSQADFQDILRKAYSGGTRAVAVRESGGKEHPFDEKVLEKIKTMGFDIVLRPGNNWGSRLEHMDEYERIVRDFNVKYIIFDGMEITGSPENIQGIGSIINKYGIIVGIIEKPEQVRYVDQKGLEDLIPYINYSINRVYITPEKDLPRLSGDEIFHRWIRCVVDRNIRFIYVNALRNPELSDSENLNETLTAVGDLNSFSASKGYAIDKPLNRLSPELPGIMHDIFVPMSLMLASLLYLSYLINLRPAYVLLLFTGGTFGILLKTFLNIDLYNMYALYAALLYPSFSSFMLLRFLRDNRHLKWILQTAAALGIIVGINAIAMYTIVTSMADIRYIMNIEVFYGVSLSFITPLIMFGINYFILYVEIDKLKQNIMKLLNYKMIFLAVGAISIFGLIFYIYMARSGSNSGVSATNLELRIRELLEEKLLARPRFKEFLVGYPALFVMVYLYKKYCQHFILLILGIAVVIGSVSMVNSFCHVFTPVRISVLRTLYGLAFGIILALLAVAFVHLLDRLYWRTLKSGNKA